MKRNTWILILVCVIAVILLFGTREHFDYTGLGLDSTDGGAGPGGGPSASPFYSPPPPDIGQAYVMQPNDVGASYIMQTPSDYGMPQQVQASYPDTSLASVSPDGSVQITSDSSVAPVSSYVADAYNPSPPFMPGPMGPGEAPAIYNIPGPTDFSSPVAAQQVTMDYGVPGTVAPAGPGGPAPVGAADAPGPAPVAAAPAAAPAAGGNVSSGPIMTKLADKLSVMLDNFLLSKG